MPARLVSRSEFARMAGVSPGAVTRASLKSLKAACHGDRINIDHPDAVSYLARHESRRTSGKKAKRGRTKRRSTRAKAPKTAPNPDASGHDSSTEALTRYRHQTLEQLTDQFGTDRTFRDWLQALKKIEDIRKARLDNEETEGRLMRRELVRTHIFGAVERSNQRLLGDAPKTIAQRLYAAARSGQSLEEAERIVRAVVSTHLEEVQKAAIRLLTEKKR